MSTLTMLVSFLSHKCLYSVLRSFIRRKSFHGGRQKNQPFVETWRKTNTEEQLTQGSIIYQPFIRKLCQRKLDHESLLSATLWRVTELISYKWFYIPFFILFYLHPNQPDLSNYAKYWFTISSILMMQTDENHDIILFIALIWWFEVTNKNKTNLRWCWLLARWFCTVHRCVHRKAVCGSQ